MIRIAAGIIIAALAAGIPPGASAGSLTAPAGYVCVDTPLNIPEDGWFGGFDFLPNGNFAISDGYNVREITRQGSPVRVLYTFSDPDPSTPGIIEPVFGSFVKYDSFSDRIYFGESTLGTVRSISAAGGDEQLLAILAYNYDIDLWAGVPYVVAGNKVYRVTGGSVDAVATAAGPSGPVIFDSNGNLIYGTGDYDWSTPNDQNIYLWSAAQVAGAGGGTILTTSQAVVLAANVNGPGGFAFGGSQELLYTDSVGWPASIRVLRNGVPETFAETNVPGQFPWTTTLRYNPSTGDIAAAVSWSVRIDGRWVTTSVISTLTPVPEPSSIVTICFFIGLAASSKRIRPRGR